MVFTIVKTAITMVTSAGASYVVYPKVVEMVPEVLSTGGKILSAIGTLGITMAISNAAGDAAERFVDCFNFRKIKEEIESEEEA